MVAEYFIEVLTDWYHSAGGVCETAVGEHSQTSCAWNCECRLSVEGRAPGSAPRVPRRLVILTKSDHDLPSRLTGRCRFCRSAGDERPVRMGMLSAKGFVLTARSRTRPMRRLGPLL